MRPPVILDGVASDSVAVDSAVEEDAMMTVGVDSVADDGVAVGMAHDADSTKTVEVNRIVNQDVSGECIRTVVEPDPVVVVISGVALQGVAPGIAEPDSCTQVDSSCSVVPDGVADQSVAIGGIDADSVSKTCNLEVLNCNARKGVIYKNAVQRAAPGYSVTIPVKGYVVILYLYRLT